MRFGIFGNPVAHSKSPLMHNSAFKACGIDGVYEKYLLLDGTKLRETFLHLGLDGANITVPHKEEAYKQADEVRGIARTIGAANTWVMEEGRIIAYNTDAPGFYEAICRWEGIQTALLIGAGGTARAIALYLRTQGIDVHLLNRTYGKLSFFADHGFSTFTWEDFVPRGYDLIINSTSAGLQDTHLPCPHEMLDVTLSQSRYAIDCIYGKETPFLRLAKEHGLATQDGEGMLLHQGVLAYEHFTHKCCDHEVVVKAMYTGLTHKQ